MYTQQTRITPANELYRCGKPTGLQSLDPQERIDTALEEKVNQTLRQDDVLRSADHDEIELHVKNRIIYMNGHLTSISSRNRIEKRLLAIAGIGGIRNNLVADDELMYEVASSLSSLERSQRCKFFTGVSYGVVMLSGEVSGPEVRKLAEQCVSRQPNVRAVINTIRIPGVKASPVNQLIQPAIGKKIYFLDGISGIVQQVVINPDNRQVVAMIIASRLDDFRYNNGVRASSQMLLIPRNIIGYLTSSSGFLTIRSTQTNLYHKVDPTLFAAPDPSWRAPYPYCPGDVLFPVEYEELPSEELLANDSLGG